LPSNQQENQRILEFVLSNPDIHADIVRRMNMVHLTNTTESISPPLNDQSHAQILDQNYQTQFQYGQQTEVSQAQIQQQQDVFSIINPCQPSELCSINDFNGTFQQPSTNVPMWQTSKTNLYFSTPNQVNKLMFSSPIYETY
jgi:transcription initiation factor TFIID subunit TAF12